MMRYSGLLLLLMLTGVAAGEIQKRVVGGRACNNNEGLHHVILAAKTNNGHYMCGGSLIKDQWVLTATHCINKTPLNDLTASLNNQGTWTKSKITAQFPYTENNQVHDITLLKLKYSFPSHYKVKLPNNCQPLSINDAVTFYGMFTVHNPSPGTSKGQSIPHNNWKLHCGDLEVAKCNDMSVYLNGNNPDLHSIASSRLLCAKDPAKKVDSCGGNSGGSLTTPDGVLRGVLSSSSKFMCGAPVKFMDVCHYIQWIHQVAKP